MKWIAPSIVAYVNRWSFWIVGVIKISKVSWSESVRGTWTSAAHGTAISFSENNEHLHSIMSKTNVLKINSDNAVRVSSSHQVFPPSTECNECKRVCDFLSFDQYWLSPQLNFKGLCVVCLVGIERKTLLEISVYIFFLKILSHTSSSTNVESESKHANMDGAITFMDKDNFWIIIVHLCYLHPDRKLPPVTV